jgi:hypothetical protein
MKAEFRSIRPSDFFEIDVNARHVGYMPALLSSPLKLLQHLADDPFSFCMTVSGKPVALCGATTEGGLWALLSQNMKPYMLRLHRYGKQMMDIYSVSGRLWAEIDRTDPAAVRWVEALGMHKVKPARENMDFWAYDPS